MRKSAWVTIFTVCLTAGQTVGFPEQTENPTTEASFFDDAFAEIDSEQYEGRANFRDVPANLTGAHLYRVQLKNNEHKRVFLDLIKTEQIDVWMQSRGKKAKAVFMVLAANVEKVNMRFYEADITLKRLSDNVQKLVDEENPSENVTKLSNSKTGYALTWKAYHKASVIHDFLDNYATNYKDLCTVEKIGNTVEGRPIKIIKISSGGDKKRPAFFIDGGIHAREWISPATVTYIIRELVENRTAYSFADEVDFYIVPLMNVDGYEHSRTRDRLWRKNRAPGALCKGVDLNRNFGYKWGGKGSSSSVCRGNHRGPSAFSEPESQAIRDFILKFDIGTFKAYLTVHSFGQYIMYPWGYDYMTPPDGTELQRVGDLAAAAVKKLTNTSYKVGSSAKLLYAAAGGSDDWAKAVAEIPYAYTLELRDKGDYGFILPAKFIKPTGLETMAMVQVVAEEMLKAERLKKN
ncbi:Hypothetical predicted protein [Cloeon dipterum]|uniref:Peptidase M14 domain-containing protein n=1 Tax=Cloeon dipterum TaxID=197152 RepID=A0A8S1CX29_9INSE|nr:Hypothetical predicted protein [Cloeon dipterum]